MISVSSNHKKTPTNEMNSSMWALGKQSALSRESAQNRSGSHERSEIININEIEIERATPQGLHEFRREQALRAL